MARSRSALISTILARVWTASVMMPAWLPVNDVASTPNPARAMHSRDIEMRSPGAEQHVHLAHGLHAADVGSQPDQLVGGVAHGTDHDHHVIARTPGPGDVIGHGADALRVGDRRSAELLDHQRHGRPRLQVRPRHPGRAKRR